MRLILVDRLAPRRRNFYPLALSRPIWELRCGMTSLAEKLVARLRPDEVACFVPPYLADVYRRQTRWPVNDPRTLAGDSLLVVDGRAKAAEFPMPATDRSQVVRDSEGETLCASIDEADLPKLETDSIESLLDSAAQSLPEASGLTVPVWNYTWDLVAANAEMLAEDFRVAGRSGIEGVLEEPVAIRGSRNDIYLAPGAKVHPMVVLDAEHGPIYIDREAEIQPFTRIEGPCYIGPQSILLAAKCRAGNSIGPVCRVGGEIENSILQGYSNKYHDGFLGHAYVGEWVNLGALTTTSDLKNDYSDVSVVLDGRTTVSAGQIKLGALIGDHAKTAIGTLLNTGAYVGAMTLIVGDGTLAPKFIPSFAWLVKNVMDLGGGKERLYTTARTFTTRRQVAWTEADAALWNQVFAMTVEERHLAFARFARRETGK
jgi:UDP-N-acetylglucosamine diphosphorylase/glucosamine-1-phosphate N-acetyltransferase